MATANKIEQDEILAYQLWLNTKARENNEESRKLWRAEAFKAQRSEARKSAESFVKRLHDSGIKLSTAPGLKAAFNELIMQPAYDISAE